MLDRPVGAALDAPHGLAMGLLGCSGDWRGTGGADKEGAEDAKYEGHCDQRREKKDKFSIRPYTRKTDQLRSES